MPSLRTIRKKIRATKNSQKITKAMKLVAAAKLRRAQMAVHHWRLFSSHHQSICRRLWLAWSQECDSTANKLPIPSLLQKRPSAQRLLMVVFGSDRGLCGGFNSNMLRRIERFHFEREEHIPTWHWLTVGRKIRDYYNNRQRLCLNHHVELSPAQNFYLSAQLLSQEILAQVARHQIEQIWVAYNYFAGGVQQEVRIRQLLPLDLGQSDYTDIESELLLTSTEKPLLLERLLAKQLILSLQGILLESAASEHSARMVAMDAATRNAREIMEQASLEYNRARQAAITRELMDIVGGAEALHQST
jgi:F-type H+-transporting ATPase subunit gamma